LAGNRDFLRLWAGQTISVFGSGVTSSALPLTAVLALGATARDMGWLLAVESAPVLLVGMVAGIWVDRIRRRPLLVGADLGRAALLACIPLLAVLGSLRMEHLFVVAAATGVLTVFFDVAFRSFMPELVGIERMLEANTRLATVDAVAEITTPGLTGAAVQVIAAPLAILQVAACEALMGANGLVLTLTGTRSCSRPISRTRCAGRLLCSLADLRGTPRPLDRNSSKCRD
jgi:MFS family permease